jgi:hypothetical protein
MRPIGNETGAAMSLRALNLRGDFAGVLPEIIRALDEGDRGSEMPGETRRLLEYWRVVLPLPLAERRRALDAACARVRRDAATSADVLRFALGDSDEDIVYRATLAHVGAFPPRQAGPTATSEAIDWVRRRLALNCAAVFAALLSLGDERVLESLLPLRSALDADEVAAIRRRMGTDCPEPARTFLRTWVDLLDQTSAIRG